MKPRELGGAIRKAKKVYLWTFISGDEGIFLEITRTLGREIVEEAKEKGFASVYAYAEEGDLFIGEPVEEEGGGAGKEDLEEEDGPEEDGEEEIEEEDGGEEDADEEEEEEESEEA